MLVGVVEGRVVHDTNTVSSTSQKTMNFLLNRLSLTKAFNKVLVTKVCYFVALSAGNTQQYNSCSDGLLSHETVIDPSI